MSALTWKADVSAEAHTFVAAAELAAALPTAEGWRLPTADEVLNVVDVSPDGKTFTFPAHHFGATVPEGAVWTADGTVVTPDAAGFVVSDAEENRKCGVYFVHSGPRRPNMAAAQRRITITGNMDCALFQQCAEAGQYLNKEHPRHFNVTVERVFGFEWERRRGELRKANPDMLHDLDVAAIDQDTGAVVSGEEFVRMAESESNFRLFTLDDADKGSYKSIAHEETVKFWKSAGSSFCYMVVTVGDIVKGRIVYQLFTDKCPRTCDNFIHLCRGDLPDAKDANGDKVRLSYAGSKIFRVVKGGWVQGGDISGERSGNGGVSIYGKTFPDESFTVPHDDVGILGMANDGAHSNSSSFYITLAKANWMDGRYVAFGRVVEGLPIIQAIAEVEVKHNQTPRVDITIDDCGVIELE